MSEDSYTEVTSQSWTSRIGESIKGLIFGFILFIAAFPLILWNEDRSIDTAVGLEEGAAAVVTVQATPVDSQNEGKLVHFNAQATTDAILADNDFGLSVNAIKLKRIVEMYQWSESQESKTEKKMGGGTETKTTYSYKKTWSDKPISSSSFKRPSEHQNPASMAYTSTESVADEVMAGSYLLPSQLVNSISNYETVKLGDKELTLPEISTVQSNSNSSTNSRMAQVAGRFTRNGNQLFSGNPSVPDVGDLRVSFSVVKPGPVSVIAKQIGQTLESFHTKTGSTISIIQSGTMSAQNMIKQAQASNTMMTWILRFVAFFVMFAGLSMVLKPLSVLADVVPIIGSIIGMGTGLIAGVLAFSLSVITIAIAWFAVRPLLSAGLLVAGVAGFFGLKKMASKKSATEAPAA